MERKAESFPRQYARTRRFTLGQPRTFTVGSDGARVVFLRSLAGDDPVNRLWVFDVDSKEERLVADPVALLGTTDEDLPAEERARRERAREAGGGVVAYATDPRASIAAFALSGRLFVSDLISGESRELPATGPVFDPRPSPPGTLIAYVTGRALHVVDLDGRDSRLVFEDDPDVSFGLAEFIAAEEMGRSRGFWWSPEGSSLAAARVDTSHVERWHVADLAEPSVEPTTLIYPAAGTANADVTLSVLDLSGGGRTDVDWEQEAFPYLVDVVWDEHGPLTAVVQSRDQRIMRILAVDPSSGHTSVLHEQRDPAWVDIVPGVPGWTAGGGLVHCADVDDTRRLMLDGGPLTPAGLHVRRVVHIGDERVVFTASEDPEEIHLYGVWLDGRVARLGNGEAVEGGEAGGMVVVITASSTAHFGTRATVFSHGRRVAEIASHAETPLLTPRVGFRRIGSRRLSAALIAPERVDPPWPVLMDPYGGPHAQRVMRARNMFLEAQWFADQGFAVVVVDGRGTPGRGSGWERSVRGDLAAPALEDQVEALHALADDRLDLSRVAIRGWSFGGYLAALAVLRRPDVFHAAIAGAPVTDWRLYDTHYTERYLGLPSEEPENYGRTSLLEEAARLERPLLLIHGLADDNVVAAHTLQLSRALLEAGRPHCVLPISGVTHMTPQEVVAENLLLLQVAFLRSALG